MKNFIPKILYLVFPIALLLVLPSVSLGAVGPCSEHDLTGYAWSSNIGWISFGCESGASIDYGVDWDFSSGNLTGYAWSSSVGWISMNPGSTPSTSVTFNNTGDSLVGWARACSVFASGCSGSLRPNSERGDWDGWLKFSGDKFDVTLDSTTKEFNGYAWGDLNLGWVSMNGSNYTVDFNAYTVTTGVGDGDGSVDIDPPGETCDDGDGSCLYHFPKSSLIETTLKANPDQFYGFVKWQNTCPGATNTNTTNPCTFDVDENYVLYAIFKDVEIVTLDIISKDTEIQGTQADLHGEVTIYNELDTEVFFRYGSYDSETGGSAPPSTCSSSTGSMSDTEKFTVTPGEGTVTEDFEIQVEELDQNRDFWYCAVARQKQGTNTETKYGNVISGQGYKTRVKPGFENF
ncbi:MAG: hypothetical protein U5L75_03455 [Candidatus Campbellbacteria bacterium]|nr:hypothetical protein [Candidatus Campbellbacteria bacterium]